MNNLIIYSLFFITLIGCNTNTNKQPYNIAYGTKSLYNTTTGTNCNCITLDVAFDSTKIDCSTLCYTILIGKDVGIYLKHGKYNVIIGSTQASRSITDTSYLWMVDSSICKQNINLCNCLSEIVKNPFLTQHITEPRNTYIKSKNCVLKYGFNHQP